MAESVALAVLENLVHMSPGDFPSNYVCVAALLPEDLVVETEQDFRHRAELRTSPPQAVGDRWIESGESAVLEVASAVVPHEHNYLLNPSHSDFERIVVYPPALFHFDPRLFR